MQSTKIALLYIVLISAGIIMVLPLIWAILISFMEKGDIIAVPPRVWPKVWTLTNYLNIQQTAPFLRFFANSLIISTVSNLVIAITCPMAGYILAKFRFKWLTIIFGLILATTFVPIETYLIPLYLLVKSFGWVNTYQGMIFPLIISSAGIFLLRQYIKSIPDSLIDSARIDGCSEFGIFWKIIFPLCWSAISAIIIINWVYTWSQVFIWYIVMASSQKMFPIEVGLMYYQRQFITDYGGMMAASVITFLPPLIFFIIFRTRIIESIAQTGTKY